MALVTNRPSAAAAAAQPLVTSLLGEPPPVRFVFWDGSEIGAGDAAGTIVVNSPAAIRRMLWAPGELGLGRAYVAGDLDVQGDVVRVLEVLRDATRRRTHSSARVAAEAAITTTWATTSIGWCSGRR